MHVKTTLSSALAAVRRRYLTALLKDPAVTKIPASTGGATLSLKQVYLPRTVLHEVKQEQSHERERDVPPAGKRPSATESTPAREVLVKEPVNLWEKLREDRVVLIEGPAGMGKSTLSKHLVRESLAQAQRLPIWIPFHRFAASQLPLDEYLDQFYVPELGLGTARVIVDGDATRGLTLGQWLYGQWRGGLGLLILDGLDEVFAPEIRTATLQRLHLKGTSRDRPVTILTTRPLTHGIPIEVAKTELQALRPTEQKQLLARYRPTVQLAEVQFQTFLQKVHIQSAGSELRGRPGHLVQMLGFYAEYQTLPITETELLTYLVHRRLRTTGRVQPPVDPDDPKMKQRLLASIALHLLACRQGQLHTRAQLLALIQQVLTEHASHHTLLFSLSQASTVLNDLVYNSGLLTRVGIDPERFHVESAIWTQLLVGTALADPQTVISLGLTDTQVLEILDKKAWDPAWEPVLKSWVGQTDNPFPLFARLTDKTQDDLARHRLGTAGRCLFEVNPRLRTSPTYGALSVQIPTEAFEVWKTEVERGTEQLVATSLRNTWEETEIGQSTLTNMIKDRKHPLSAIPLAGGLRGSLSADGQEVLVAQLQDEDDSVRLAAAGALSMRGAELSTVSQEALATWLMEEDEWVWRAESEFLNRLGVALSAPGQMVLVARSGDTDRWVRLSAARNLGRLSATLSPVGQKALVERLTDEDEEVREAAVEALGNRGVGLLVAAQEALVARLSDEKASVRKVAVEALSKLGSTLLPAGAAALVGRLTDENAEVRRAAIEALGELRVTLSPAGRAALITRMRDEDWVGGLGAATTIQRLEIVLTVAEQEEIIAWLKHEDPGVRRAAVEAFGNLGVTALPAGPAVLVGRLTDEDEEIRRMAIETLGRLGVGLSVAGREALVARLTDENAEVRRAAVEALGELRATLSPAGRAVLVTRLRDEDEWVRKRTTSTIQRLGIVLTVAEQEKVIAFIREAEGRMFFPWNFGLFDGVLSVMGHSTLIELLRDKHFGIRWEAAKALGKLGVGLSAAGREALVARLTDENEEVREAVVYALGRLGVRLSLAEQKSLAGRLRDEYTDVRRAAVTVIGDVTVAQLVAVQQALLSGGLIAEVLGNLGATLSDSVLSVLIKLSWDEDVDLRIAAAEVLWRIGAALLTVQKVILRQPEHSAMLVWTEGVQIFGELGAGLSSAGQKALFELIRDSEWSVRKAAVEAMLNLEVAVSSAGQEVGHRIVKHEGQWESAAQKALISLGVALSSSGQDQLIEWFADEGADVRRVAASVLFSTQQDGLRIFYTGGMSRPGRKTSDLSATTLLSDCCAHHEPVRYPFSRFHSMPN